MTLVNTNGDKREITDKSVIDMFIEAGWTEFIKSPEPVRNGKKDKKTDE